MDDFTVTVRIIKKDYAKIFLTEMYKKPFSVFATVFGLYLLTTVILDYYGVINFYTEVPVFEIVCGSVMLLFPWLITLMAIHQFRGNKNLQNGIQYTFSSGGIFVQGTTFKGEFSWEHIIKQKETGRYLILYQGKRLGMFIDKSNLTNDQIQFIKRKRSQEGRTV